MISDLVYALLFLGIGAAVFFLPRWLEIESGDAGLLAGRGETHLAKRLGMANLGLLLLLLPVYMKFAGEGSIRGFLWFWARSAGFAQLLYVVPVYLSEKDKVLLAAGKIGAAASTAALFAGLSSSGSVARSGAASLAAITSALYGLYVLSRLRR